MKNQRQIKTKSPKQVKTIQKKGPEVAKKKSNKVARNARLGDVAKSQVKRKSAEMLALGALQKHKAF